MVDYAVTEMGCFDEYQDAAPRAKKMRVNGITSFLLTFNQTKVFTITLIAKAQLKSLYSRLGFKVIKDFSTSPNFEKNRNQFQYESGKSKSLRGKKLAYNVF